ncbi:MAG: hypothetical protein K2G51_12595 [Lachnospiraceae bacterium]|nr:hypothetical protein [Lachnospiraceae bacterium]
MSKITCKCGNILHDNTDQIRYKGYIISDGEFFDLFDFADEMIESGSPCREDMAMTFRHNIGIGEKRIRLKELYQCPLCGRVLIEITPGQFCYFVPEGHEEKNLLDYRAGELIEFKQRLI